MEGILAHGIFSIPGVKGVSFGRGFAFSSMLGSEANDGFYKENGVVKTRTNNNGGINGGISNGNPVIFSVAIKPTASISRTQRSISLKTGEMT
jgi:chorismate synthase